MPDVLMEKVRAVLARRNLTFRALVIDAVERAIEGDPGPFLLRDASAGFAARKDRRISETAINQAIDDIRSHPINP